MKKNNLEKLDLTLYSEKLDNGLEVYVVPKNNVNGVYVTFSTKYGSNIIEFVPRGEDKMIKVPLGIAHFLEHKMFENEDMEEPFKFYSERGCDANANTSNTKTTYLFSGANAVEENINFLLDYVQKPYFTDENVEKEKGIIEQEIKMYDDQPYYCLYYGLLNNVFHNHPYKYTIGGSVEDIKSITKEQLYTCYNTFYHPSNMFVVVVGAVDPKEIIEIIKINQKNKKFTEPTEIITKIYNEPDTVCKAEETKKMDIEIPKIGIAYKLSFPKSKRKIIDLKNYLSILFSIKLGSTSELNEKLKNKNIITHDLGISLINTDKHIILIITTETNDINSLKKAIFEELKDLTISESDFDRKLKVRKSSCIYGADSIYSINSKIMNNIMNYNEVILDDYKNIERFKYSDLVKLSKKIKLDNKTIYTIVKS